jgi:hypothetical protein
MTGTPDDLDVRLRAAFAHRARTTDVGDVAPPPMMRIVDTTRPDNTPASDVAIFVSRRRRWVIPASVAASALLIVGLVGLARVREATPIEPAATPVETTTSPAPSTPLVAADLVIVDPLALDLDDWRTSEPAAGSFTVIDNASLPDGYELTDEEGGVLRSVCSSTGSGPACATR